MRASATIDSGGGSGLSALGGKHVVVVGGAIGGSAAALLLAGAGAHVTLLERVDVPRAVGAGILLQPNGLAVLYGLGLQPQLMARGLVSRAVVLCDGAQRPILRTVVPNSGAGPDHMLVIRRSNLFTILLDAVDAADGIDARFGANVIAAGPDGSVTYEDKDGQGSLQADLIVGADGIHSCVREGGRFEAHLQSTGVSYVRGLSPARLDIMDASEAWTSLGIFGMAPVSGGSYFYSSVRARVLAEAIAQRDLEAYRSAWVHAYPPSGVVLEPLERFDDLLVNEVEEVRCERFVDGKLVLLGDAAHAMAPNLGQGANSALVDAAVLTHELREASAWDGALQRYDARRRPAVTKVQTTARRLSSAGEIERPLLRTLRDAAVRALAFLPNSTERATRQAQQEDPAWLLREARLSARESRS